MLVVSAPVKGEAVFREGRFRGIGVMRKFGLAFSPEILGFGRFREFAADGLTYGFAEAGRNRLQALNRPRRRLPRALARAYQSAWGRSDVFGFRG